jgi:tetratricopeptide (TPR) repeat protein
MVAIYRNISAWFRRRPRRQKRLKYGLIALAVVAALAVSARPVAGLIRGWQSRRLAAEANALIQQGQWRDASKKALDAVRLRPDEPTAMDSVAHLLSRTRQSATAMEWWKKIEKTRPLSLSDRREYAAAALDSGEIAIASAQIDVLLAQKPAPSAEDLVLAAQLQTLKGYSAAAVDYAEQVLKDPKAPSRDVFDSAVVIFTNTTPQSISYGGAVDRLVELVRNEKSPVSLQALRLLEADSPRRRLSDPGSTPLVINPPRYQKIVISRGEVADLLEKHPNAEARDKLLALQLRAEGDPARAGDYTKAGMEMFRHDDDAAPALAAWLYDRGQFERVLEVVPLDRALPNRALYLWRIDALAALGRYTEAKDMLLSEDSALDQVSQHMLLAVLSTRMGEATAGTNEWERAFEAANTTPKLQILARFAEANNEPQIADRAWVEVLTQNPRLRSAYLARLRLAQAVGNTVGAQKIAAQIIRMWPDDTATRIREVYLRLLLGGTPGEVAAAQTDLDKLLSNQSLGWNGRGTLALAYLRNGRPAAALSTLNQSGPATPPPPNILAMRANALAANGWKDKAKAEAKKLVTVKLLPEERALIAPLLKDEPTGKQ